MLKFAKGMLVVLVTVPDSNEGERLAKSIIEKKLAACVQILPQMRSIYFWDGKVQNDSEHLLLIKTLEDKFEALRDFIQENHSYEVPEILAIEAAKVSDDYLKWVRDTTRSGSGRSQNRER